MYVGPPLQNEYVVFNLSIITSTRVNVHVVFRLWVRINVYYEKKP